MDVYMNGNGASPPRCPSDETLPPHSQLDSLSQPGSGYRLGTSERQKLELLLKEKRNTEMQMREHVRLRKNCTFAPKVNNGSAKSDLRVEERLLNFEKQKRAKLQRELLAKIEADQQRYSFTPSIDIKSLQTATKLHPSHLSVEDRLMHYKASVEKSKRLLREHAIEQEVLQRKLATPMTVNRRSQSVESRQALNKPFLQRMKEAELQRSSSVALLKDRDLQACTFKPSISRMSKVYEEEREQRLQHKDTSHTDLNQSGRPVRAQSASRVESLYRDAQTRATVLEHKRFAKALQETTSIGKPYISSGTDRIVREGPMKDVYSCNFIQRQEIFQQLAHEHAKVLAVVSDRPSLLSPNGSDGRQLTSIEMENQVDRLYTRSTEVSKQLRQLLQDKTIANQCTFKPALSRATELFMSKEGEEREDVVERLTRKLAQPKDAASPPDNQNAPGTPRRAPVSMRDAELFYRRQLVNLKQKQKLIDERKAIRIIDEQKDCTFQPDIQPYHTERRASSAPHSLNTSIDSQAKSITGIVGADSFLKRQRVARDRRKEKVDQLNNLGKGKVCNGPNFTVVRPFHLSKGRGQSRDLNIHFDPNTQFEQPLTKIQPSRLFGQPLNPNVSISYPFKQPGRSFSETKMDATIESVTKLLNATSQFADTRVREKELELLNSALGKYDERYN